MPKTKKRKKSPNCSLTESQVCCICHESCPGELLYLGCSNYHLICHLCSRYLLSEKITVANFPLNVPTQILPLLNLTCPLCQEAVQGISNLFAPVQIQPFLWTCPYRALHQCDFQATTALTTQTIQTHLKTHNNVVRCPHCQSWISEGSSMIEGLRRHLTHVCQHIPCRGCNRQGSLLQLFLHSATGQAGTCQHSQTVWFRFGQAIHTLVRGDPPLEEEEEEKVEPPPLLLPHLAQFMLRWMVEFWLSRRQIKFTDTLMARFLELAWTKFHRHFDVMNPTLLSRLKTLIQSDDPVTYRHLVKQKLHQLCQRKHKRLNQLHTFGFQYQLLMSVFLDFPTMSTFFSLPATSVIEDEHLKALQDLSHIFCQTNNLQTIEFSFILPSRR